MSGLKSRGSIGHIRQMSGQVSRGSGGEYQADERATGDTGSIPGREHPLEKEMSTHSRILA